MERIEGLLPSILVIDCIAVATHFYLKWIVKRFGKDNLKSVAWLEKNKGKVGWVIGRPLINVWAPAVEELIFRAPLIIAFNAVSSVSWYGIFTSSGIFALIHWFGKKIWMPDILSAQENGELKTDDVEVEINRLHQEKGKEITARKALNVVFTLPVGILAGYYGIKYQSIWVSFGIHSLWNLIMPFVLQLIVLLVLLAVVGIKSLRDRVKWERSNSW